MQAYWIWLEAIGAITVLSFLVVPFTSDDVMFGAKVTCVPEGDGLHLLPVHALGNRIVWAALAVSLGGIGLLCISGTPLLAWVAVDDLRSNGFRWLDVVLGVPLVLGLLAVGALLVWLAVGTLRNNWSGGPIVEIRFVVEAGAKHLDIAARRLLRTRRWRVPVAQVRQVDVASREQMDVIGWIGSRSIDRHGSMRPFLVLENDEPLPLMPWGRDGPGARKLVEMIRAWCGVAPGADERLAPVGPFDIARKVPHRAAAPAKRQGTGRRTLRKRN